MGDLDQWSNFFVASAGAAAALAGLFVVAVSVNVEAILAERELPARTGATLGALVLALSVSLAGLMRDQTLTWLGAEVLVFAALAWAGKVHAARRMLAAGTTQGVRRQVVVAEVLAGQFQTIPFLVGGVLLAGGSAQGLNWVGFGVITVFALSMLTTWVLLIEIRR